MMIVQRRCSCGRRAPVEVTLTPIVPNTAALFEQDTHTRTWMILAPIFLHEFDFIRAAHDAAAHGCITATTAMFAEVGNNGCPLVA